MSYIRSSILHLRDIPSETLSYFRSGRSNAASIYDVIQNVYSRVYHSYPYDVQIGLAPPSPTHNSGVTYGDLLEAKRVVATHYGQTLEDYLAEELFIRELPPYIPSATTGGYTAPTTGGASAAMEVDEPMTTGGASLRLYDSKAMDDDEPLLTLHAYKEPEEPEEPFWGPPTYVDFEYGVGTFLYRASEVIRKRGFASLSAFWNTIREGDSVTYVDDDGTAFTYSYEAVHRSDNNGNKVTSDNYKGIYMEGFF